MNSKEIKQIRGQIRQVVAELFPTMLSEAVKNELYKSLQTEVGARLTKIENNVKETLSALDERQKDTLGYLVRQVSSPIPSEAPVAVTDTPKSE